MRLTRLLRTAAQEAEALPEVIYRPRGLKLGGPIADKTQLPAQDFPSPTPPARRAPPNSSTPKQRASPKLQRSPRKPKPSSGAETAPGQEHADSDPVARLRPLPPSFKVTEAKNPVPYVGNLSQLLSLRADRALGTSFTPTHASFQPPNALTQVLTGKDAKPSALQIASHSAAQNPSLSDQGRQELVQLIDQLAR